MTIPVLWRRLKCFVLGHPRSDTPGYCWRCDKYIRPQETNHEW